MIILLFTPNLETENFETDSLSRVGGVIRDFVMGEFSYAVVHEKDS